MTCSLNEMIICQPGSAAKFCGSWRQVENSARDHFVGTTLMTVFGAANKIFSAFQGHPPFPWSRLQVHSIVSGLLWSWHETYLTLFWSFSCGDILCVELNPGIVARTSLKSLSSGPVSVNFMQSSRQRMNISHVVFNNSADCTFSFKSSLILIVCTWKPAFNQRDA